MISKIIEKEIAKSEGQVEIIEVPEPMRPHPAELSKLNREIAAQVSANEAMRERSMLYAARGM